MTELTKDAQNKEALRQHLAEGSKQIRNGEGIADSDAAFERLIAFLKV